MDEKIAELIAIGASVSANCHPCVEYHVTKARDMGIAPEQIRQAIGVGKTVRAGAARQMDELVAGMLA
jgi:AhpD family alkylhydroperoxidase